MCLKKYEGSEESGLERVFFDGRRDKTQLIIYDEDGDEFPRTECEEHFTLTDSHKYFTQVTLVLG